MSVNPRQIRAIKTFINGSIMSESLDFIAECCNSPELISSLRRKGLKIPCEKVERLDKDGRTCYPSCYPLRAEDKQLIMEEGWV